MFCLSINGQLYWECLEETPAMFWRIKLHVHLTLGQLFTRITLNFPWLKAARITWEVTAAAPIWTAKLCLKTSSVPAWQSNTDAFGALQHFHREPINLDPNLLLARHSKSTEKRSEKLYLSLITITAKVWLGSWFTSLQRKGEPSSCADKVLAKWNQINLRDAVGFVCLLACCPMTSAQCPVYLHFNLNWALVSLCQSCAKGT